MNDTDDNEVRLRRQAAMGAQRQGQGPGGQARAQGAGRQAQEQPASQNPPDQGGDEAPNTDNDLLISLPIEPGATVSSPNGAGNPVRLKPVGNKFPQTGRTGAMQVGGRGWAVESLRIDIAAATQKKRRRFLLRMFFWVIMPTLLMTAYIFLYATPRYVSEFQITYQSYGSSQSSSSASAGLLSSLMGGAGGGTVDMTQVLESYLTSETLLRTVDKQLNLRAHYSDPKIDWIDRLSSDASQEKFLDYFQRRISVDNMVGGYLIVDIATFDPKYSVAVATAITKAADEMVDNMTGRARSEEVRVAEDELKKTQDRLIKATQDVTAFQNEHRDFNPTTGASQLDTVIGGLETQLSQARAQLTGAQSFIAPNSPQIAALTSRIAALDQQIMAEKRRLASTETTTSGAPLANRGAAQGSPYSKIVADYTALQLEQNFASQSYLSAKSAYDLAKADAMRKENFIESFVSPNLPQKSTSPNPWTYIPGTFFFSLFAYAIGSLLLGSFRDQAGA
ncbi:MAG: hypothetical protein P4M15_10245 [Alphaproteobacteria bacterium]|nr:hypothetical protein [Alphaproteobacteria bacterium]